MVDQDHNPDPPSRSLFFRVEHDLLRSEAFRELGGSAIKVYLVIGLYSDFGSDWAHPSIRTISRQAGLSRQTVLTAIRELCNRGWLATRKSPGRATQYKIVRPGPDPRASERSTNGTTEGQPSPKSFSERPQAGPIFFKGLPDPVQKPDLLGAQALDSFGPDGGPKQQEDPKTDQDNEEPTIPIPGTPFRLTADGRLLVAVDLQELLKAQGLPARTAATLTAQRAPEDVAKVLLNAFYLQSTGKLQNGPGYIRAGLEDGYELLPQVAMRLEDRRRELRTRLAELESTAKRRRQREREASEEEAIGLVLERLGAEEVRELIERALACLPEPIVRHNPTLSNPFVRSKVYELACGEPSR